MSFASRRTINLAALVISVGLLTYAYYAQFYQGLEPCPLCIFQRVALMALAVIFLIAALHHPVAWGARVYAVLIVCAAAIGAAVAGRHIWLQSLPPDQVPECGPGLAYMLQAFPWSDTLRMVFTGSGECAQVDWRFLGLSMPAWVLVWFLTLGLVGGWVNWRSRR
jgi:protein dithiol:quinone oxidoreductase